jgi:DNA invertase Pin-like site-specific DNA recombinase
MLLGYARVSTIDQNLALQRDTLAEAGCGKIFTQQLPGNVAGDLQRAPPAHSLRFDRDDAQRG